MRKHIKTLLISILTIFILLGFAVPVNMVGNWYQQFMPNLGGRQIVDITFTDSLNGYAIINRLTLQDTSFILRTTNSGDNWNFIYADSGVTYSSLKFINQNTGFVGGYIYKVGSFKLVKTTNAGSNWFYINAPFDVPVSELFALNENTIWLASSSNPTGGVFFTSNGGGSWTNQLSLGSQNPLKIYMYNMDTGFIAKNTGSAYIMRTTNSGLNWNPFVSGRGFTDMFFVNSLTGWTAFDSVRKTTNGGLNWQTQVLPYGPGISAIFNTRFSYLNADTIWLGGGRIIFPNSQARGILFRTTNGGLNWLYQIPDTTIHSGIFQNVQFINKRIGWCYWSAGGIHTTNGGDTTFLEIKQISSEIPKEFRLFQNYPNPFNPKTLIKYQITGNKYQKEENVKLVIFDISGKEVITLVNHKQSAGTYAVDFSGIGYASGVYFYSLIIDGVLIDTKRMILIK